MDSGCYYVLFREDPNTHREVYFWFLQENAPRQTAKLHLAMPFETAREAYEFGDRHGMIYWRVGLRDPLP